MDARVPHAPFEDAGGLERLAFQRGLLADRLELFHHGKSLAPDLLLQRLVVQAEHLFEGDVWNELGQTVGVAQRQFHHPCRIADGGLGRHGAVRDDLGHLVGAVLVDDVIDDLAPTLVVEVDVDVGQAHAVRVEEPLKQQVVLDRVDVGDPHAVCDRRTCG